MGKQRRFYFVVLLRMNIIANEFFGTVYLYSTICFECFVRRQKKQERDKRKELLEQKKELAEEMEGGKLDKLRKAIQVKDF